MEWLIGIIATGLGLLLVKGSNRSTESLNLSMGSGYNTETWRPLIKVLAAKENPQLNVEYLLKWIDLESGGNPCSIGNPKSGPDGFPKEMGIAQIYNPDDYSFLKVTGKELRAYCGPGYSNKVTRPLTTSEMQDQAQTLIDLVKHCILKTNAQMRLAGVNWSIYSKDYWKAVKLYHALPSLVQALPSTTKLLKRPPSNWNEFVSTAKKLGDNYSNDRALKSFSIADRNGEAFSGPSII